ncbi:hypothetical protein [Pseudonocardia pini]|uniref:hypothetical protein n=1 Tax=Pseudonocardia pini TaxID=2758030 RepID=UPI0015F10D75|nr:hypothetical protein [Pseudonocardia pini]
MTAPRWDDPEPVPVRLETPSAATALRVDPERVHTLVARLDSVIRDIVDLEHQLRAPRIVSAGEDPVSRNAALQSSLMLRASIDYLSSWRGSMIAAREAIVRQAEGYRQVDIGARA